ncbi:MAG: hypothetical protein PHS57_05795 [Alphaproteobacteria bacterium]|nr:hypothetical protein [Alphaproteobacteria bacterium]
MYKLEDFKRDVEQDHAEVVFTFKDEVYFISENIGTGTNNEPLYISGPQNDEFVQNADEVLDRLLVDGIPMREQMDAIEPD